MVQNRTESTTAVLRVRLSNPCHPCVNVEFVCQDDVDETAATWPVWKR